MTRVEKYRRYRNEISNMKFETFLEKHEAANKIDKIHNKNLGDKLNYEEVMVVHEVYEHDDIPFKRKKFIGLTKYEIFYYLIGIIIIAIIIFGLFMEGLRLWG